MGVGEDLPLAGASFFGGEGSCLRSRPEGVFGGAAAAGVGVCEARAEELGLELETSSVSPQPFLKRKTLVSFFLSYRFMR